MGKKKKKNKNKNPEDIEKKKKRRKGEKKEKPIPVPGEYKISKRVEIVREKILREYRWNRDNRNFDDKDYDSIMAHQVITGLCPDATEEPDELVSEVIKHVGITNNNIFSEYIERNAEDKKKNVRVLIGSCALLLMAEYGYSLQGVLDIFQSERWRKKMKKTEIIYRIENAVSKVCLYEDLVDYLTEKIQSYQPEKFEEEEENE